MATSIRRAGLRISRGRRWTKCPPKTEGFSLKRDVCFSNRPFEVKRFQTIHCYSVFVARGLVLLFGIGTKVPDGIRERGGIIFWAALPSE
jgi:hypothetical protein